MPSRNATACAMRCFSWSLAEFSGFIGVASAWVGVGALDFLLPQAASTSAMVTMRHMVLVFKITGQLAPLLDPIVVAIAADDVVFSEELLIGWFIFVQSRLSSPGTVIRYQTDSDELSPLKAYPNNSLRQGNLPATFPTRDELPTRR
jgi:hypothetical protein